MSNQFEIINVLNNLNILDEALLNNDESWGETISDWENHFNLLLDEGCYDIEEIDFETKKISNPIQFMIYYLQSNLR